MNYLEKVNKKCREYNLYESIDLDIKMFNDLFLDSLFSIYKKKGFYVQDDEMLKFVKLKFDDNNRPYLDFITNYGNYISIIADNFYTGIEHSLIVFEDAIVDECFHHFLEINENKYRKMFANSSLVQFDFKREFQKSFDNVLSSIDDYYKDTRVSSISFFSTIDVGKNNSQDGGSGGSPKRKNDLISFEIRTEVLENNKYAYKIEARDLNKNSVDNDYVVYCYRLPNERIRFIAEPVSGCRYTKVAYFKMNNMTKEKAENISKKMLEYSQNDITNITNITRHQHSDIKQYLELVKYILENNGEVGLGLQRRIENASKFESNDFLKKQKGS